MNINALAGIFIALYLARVLQQGNGDAFTQQILAEKGFLPWFVGIVILYAIYKKVDKGVGGMLITLTFVAMMLSQGSAVLTTLQEFFKPSQN